MVLQTRVDVPSSTSVPGRQLAHWLLLGGVLAPILLVAAYLVAGAVRPGYSPIHQVISDLGVGPNSGIFDAVIAVVGFLIVLFAVGFGLCMRGELSPGWRWVCAALLSLHGLGLIVAAIFTEAPATVNIHWMVGANLGFFAPVIAFLVVGLLWLRHSTLRGLGAFTLIMGLLVIISLALMIWVFIPGTTLAPVHLGGLMERVVAATIEVWYVVAGWYLFVSRGPRAVERPQGAVQSKNK